MPKLRQRCKIPNEGRVERPEPRMRAIASRVLMILQEPAPLTILPFNYIRSCDLKTATFKKVEPMMRVFLGGASLLLAIFFSVGDQRNAGVHRFGLNLARRNAVGCMLLPDFLAAPRARPLLMEASKMAPIVGNVLRPTRLNVRLLQCRACRSSGTSRFMSEAPKFTPATISSIGNGRFL